MATPGGLTLFRTGDALVGLGFVFSAKKMHHIIRIYIKSYIIRNSLIIGLALKGDYVCKLSYKSDDYDIS